MAVFAFAPRKAIRLIAVIVPGTACSFAALDGFSGGRPDAATSDNDANAMDASTLPADGSSKRCGDEADATFCTDFDDFRVELGWDGKDIGNGGIVAQDDASATTAPFSFVAELLPDSGAYGREALLWKRFSLAPKKIRISFDFRSDSIPLDGPDSDIMYFRVALGATGSDGVYTLNMSMGELGLFFWQQNFVAGVAQETGPYIRLSRTPPPGVWAHADILIDFVAQPRRLRVSLDGKEVASGDLYATSYTSPLDVRLGAAAYALTAPLLLRFDHFVARVD